MKFVQEAVPYFMYTPTKKISEIEEYKKELLGIIDNISKL